MSKITMPARALKLALQGLGKIIRRTPAIDALKCVLVDGPSISATDLEAHVRCALPEAREAEGPPFLAPFAELAAICKGSRADGEISLAAEGDGTVNVRYPVAGQSLVSALAAPDAADYPVTPEISAAPEPLPEGFPQRLREALSCSSSDAARYVLQGAFLDVGGGGGHYLVGTDGRHLFSANGFVLPLQESLIVPASKFLLWQGFLEDGPWAIASQESDDGRPWIRFSGSRWSFTCRALEGSYPNWRQVVPARDAFPTRIAFDPAALPDLCRVLAALPGADAENKPVGIVVRGGAVALRAAPAQGAPAEVPVTGAAASGPDAEATFNRDYPIKAFAMGLHELSLIDGRSAARFSDGGGRTMIAMPVRLGDAVGARAPDDAPETTGPDAPEDAPGQETTTNGKEPMNNATTETAAHAGGNGNGAARGAAARNQEPGDGLETAIGLVERARAEARALAATLAEAAGALRDAQRGRRASAREVEGVRNALAQLRKARL